MRRVAIPVLALLLQSSLAADVDLIAGVKAQVRATGTNAVFAWAETLTLSQPGEYVLEAKVAFAVANPGASEFLTLVKPEFANDWELNGAPLAIPMPGLRYRQIPRIPATLLKKGANTLTARWKIRPDPYDPESAAEPPGLIEMPVQLLTASVGAPAFEMGPVIGKAGGMFLAIACKTDIPAAVTLAVAGKSYSSSNGYYHFFRVNGLQPATSYEYRLTAASADKRTTAIGPFSAKTLPDKGDLVFVALGDNRTNPTVWGEVSELARRQQPAFVLHSGDFVSTGYSADAWTVEFAKPAEALLRTVPMLAVRGNHERNSPLFSRLFADDGAEDLWTTSVSAVDIVGIDGEKDWTPGTARYKQLEGVLSRSKAGFVILLTHYPGWSGGKHGMVKPGEVPETTRVQFREFLFPLLTKYHVTAAVTAHEHFYERFEIENKLTEIITGGAGTALGRGYSKAPDNPDAAWAQRFHLLRFTLKGTALRMEAVGLDGKVFDERSWAPRETRKE